MIPRLLLLLLVMLAGPSAAGPAIPQYWDERERLVLPDISGYARVRFLTTVDFPPFNHLDGTGRLIGFHVELARAICAELDIVAACQIQALPWDELPSALETGQGEAIIAGLAVSRENRERFTFTRPYLEFPARFVGRATSLAEPLHGAVGGLRIGVLAGSAHEAMLRDYFPAARPVTYSRSSWMMRDLKAGGVDAVFGDGMRLAFWLPSEDAENCCRFAGGPYLAPDYLGRGLAIAVSHENAALAQAFDYALREISVRGTFAELYLRHFPVSFY